MESLIRDRLSRAMGRLGLTPAPGEDEIVRQLRGEILRAIGTLGNDQAIQTRARDLYAGYRRDPLGVDPDVLAAAIAILAYTGGETEYSEFVGAFKRAKTPQEEQRYLYSLAGFRDPFLLQRTLDQTVNGEIRSQDAPFLLRTLLLSVEAREVAWPFVKEHWETMERRYPAGGLRRMCEGITGLVTARLEEDVRQFFTSRHISLGGKTLEQYLEQLRIAVAFGEREASPLRSYLAVF